MDVYIQEVVDSYSNYLAKFDQKHHSKCLKKFQRLLQRDQEAARSEALVFSWLHSLGLRPEPVDRGMGGIDFLCHPHSFRKFYVEVTALDPEAMAKESGIPNDPHQPEGSFNPITWGLLRKTIKKVRQMAGLSHPRLLIITGSHFMSNALLCNLGPALLTGDTRIEVPLHNIDSPIRISSQLSNSVFFRFLRGKLQPCRKTISAILFMALSGNQCHINGIIHPEPIMSFDIKSLPEVPFFRLKSWPIIDGVIQTEWIGPPSRPAIFKYVPLQDNDS
jgi:hypothetical protein